MRRFILIALVALTLPRISAAQSLADAETLPKGSGGLIIQPAVGYGPGALQRFANGWRFGRESLVADFDGIDLGTVVGLEDACDDEQRAMTPECICRDPSMQMTSMCDGITPLERPLTFGTTSFEAKQQAFGINFIAAYGITDRLMLIGLLPFMHVRYTLDAALTPEGDRHASFRVINPEEFDCPGGELNTQELLNPDSPVLIDGGDGYKFNVADLNRALTSRCLDYASVVDRLETRNGVVHGISERSYSGIRDSAIAAKYQLFRGRWIHLGLLGYVIFPTGKPDDPRELFDFKFGDGNWGAALLANMTIPLGNFRIGLSAGYEFEAPDEIEIRANGLSFSPTLEGRLARGEITEEELFDKHLDEGQLLPIVTRFDQVKVKRKLGDNIYVYSQFSYQILDWPAVGLTINFLHHFRDRINSIGPRPGGADPYMTEAAIREEVARRDAAGEYEDDDARIDDLRGRLSESDGRKKAAYAWRTVRGNLDVGLGLFVNTLPLFARGDFPIPILAGVGINRFIAGQNLDTPEAINFQISIPFVTTLDIADPDEYGYDDEVDGGLPFP